MSLARNPRQYKGVRAILPPDLQMATRAPTSSDKAYVKGTLWLDTDASTAYMWPGSGNWISLGSGTTGAIVTLTGDSGGAISPVGGNIDILGTADQINVIGTAGTLTVSLAENVVIAGSLEVTTSLLVGTNITSTQGNLTLNEGNLIMTLGDLTLTSGNIAVDSGNLSVSETITAYDDIILQSSATQFQVKGGAATDFIGTAVLVNGTVTVLNTNIAATDRILVTRSAVNASTALGVFKVVKTASTNFVITACKPADATTETGDLSTVEYVIIRQI